MTDEPTQLEKFEALARELETDTDTERFRARLGKLVKRPAPKTEKPDGG